MDKNTAEKAAKILLKIGAITLNPKKPYKYSSGILSPVYTDCRLLISYPKERTAIRDLYIKNIKSLRNFDVIAGTATAGIPHAAWVSDVLNLPMVYVRSKAKEHGRSNQIEGKIEAGQKVVVVEDLISTGGSSIDAVRALQDQGCVVLGVVSIFTYNLKRADELFEEAGIPYISLTNFDALVEVASQAKQISEEDKPQLIEWHEKLKHGQL